MQCNAMQCNAMQCNAMQCNAMQCNAMLNIVYHSWSGVAYVFGCVCTLCLRKRGATRLL